MLCNPSAHVWKTTPGWQVAEHVEDAIWPGIDATLLAEDELDEVRGIEGLFRNQVLQEIEVSWMIEEYLRFDADLTEGVGGALSLVERRDADAARTRLAPPERHRSGVERHEIRSCFDRRGFVVMNRTKDRVRFDRHLGNRLGIVDEDVRRCSADQFVDLSIPLGIMGVAVGIPRDTSVNVNDAGACGEERFRGLSLLLSGRRNPGMIALAVFASGCARHDDWRHAVIDPLRVFPGIDKAPARTHLADGFPPSENVASARDREPRRELLRPADSDARPR